MYTRKWKGSYCKDAHKGDPQHMETAIHAPAASIPVGHQIRGVDPNPQERHFPTGFACAIWRPAEVVSLWGIETRRLPQSLPGFGLLARASLHS